MWANRMAETLTADEAREYLGHYYCEALGVVYSVGMDEEDFHLSYRRIGEDRTFMLYAGNDTFASGYGFVYFTRDEEGGVESFSLSHEWLGQGRITFERLGS